MNLLGRRPPGHRRGKAAPDAVEDPDDLRGAAIGGQVDRAPRIPLLTEHAVGHGEPAVVAIAYAPSGASGKAWHQRTPARAEQVALEKCGDKTCKVVSRFTRCGAVAYNGSKYQGGTGLTRRAAEDDAVNRLEGGRIVNWACN